jgi:hypothetical protein
VTKSSQSVRAFNINKSRDRWTRVNMQKTIKIIAKTVDNHCKYIVVIYTNKTGSQKICKPQDRRPDFLRTGKTVTVVLPGLVTVRSGPRSFFGWSNRTLKHYCCPTNASITCQWHVIPYINCGRPGCPTCLRTPQLDNLN